MILPGHVSAAALAAEALGVDPRGTLSACMFPDLIDKPVRWLFRLTPNDRIPAHTFLVYLLSTFAVSWGMGRRFGIGWFVGYGTHLACDELNAHLNPGRIYLWWPIKRYGMHVGPTGLQSSLRDFSLASIAIELGLTLVAARRWLGRRRAG